MKIIYKNENGGVSVIHPLLGGKLTIKQIAAKDVPEGRPYAIVKDDAIPADRTFRDAWDVDENTLTDGVGEGKS